MMHAPVLVEDQLDSVPLDPQEFVEALLALPDEAARRRLLVENARLLTEGDLDELAKRLKKETDQLMWADIDRCLQVAELIGELANTVANPEYRALSLLAQGNAFSIGLGEYARSITCYDEAAAIYEARDQHVQQAQSQIGKIYALANLGRYDEALATGNWASEVFRAHKEWLTLAKITVNLAIIHGRLGQDGEALELFDQARELYHRLGSELEDRLLTVESNRAIVLRNLGRFQESIEASNKTLTGYHELGQTIAVAQARQSLALTYFVMGRYNEALNLLNEARDAFLADGRERHAMLVELFISDCFLQLRRFPDVLEKCRQVREVFAELGTRFEVGQAILNEACAYVGLKQYDKALASLTEARHLFEQEGNHIAVADTNLQVAAVLLHQAQPDKSFLLTQSSAAVFEEHELPVGQARAYLVAAQAALALGRHEEARDLVDRALRLGEDHRVLTLTYQGHRLRGKLEVKVGHKQEGLAAYEQAIQELERLSGRLMIEYRADFIEDKARIYEDAVLLCLDLNWPSQGLAYSERAKSRALQDLVALRLNLRVEARSKTDRPLVEELHHLRSERDRLYRRREAGESMAQRGHMDERFDEQQRVEQEVGALEKRITALWHKLLVRNADYARDASLWRIQTEPGQPYLDEKTLLLEYFLARDQLIAFVVTADQLKAHRLSGDLVQIKHLLQLLWLNLRSAARSEPGYREYLTANVQGVAKKLYQLLIEPLIAELKPFDNLIIVPHGPLHYLPFHALYTGKNYLLQQYEVSYLPGSSLLRYCRQTQPGAGGVVAVGHSYQERLPHTLREAEAVAALWQGQVVLENAATLAHVQQVAPTALILHLATHGDFRPDNPLFSGLALADGWLTTLDIFNLRLKASLVTLSACQTGRSVVGGGDELLGLMRAFLGAGAMSLVSTLWAVEDNSTAELMYAFYCNLAGGKTKGAALRQAQLRFIQDSELAKEYAHPYFWAPFFLVGDAGPL